MQEQAHNHMMVNALTGSEVWEEMECKAWFGNRGSQPSQNQAVLKLSFSEIQRPSSTYFGGEQSDLHTEDDKSLLESTNLKEPQASIIAEKPQRHLCVTEIKEDVHSFTREERMNFAGYNLTAMGSNEGYLAISSDLQYEIYKPEIKGLQPENNLGDSVKDQSTFNTNSGHVESCEGCSEGPQWSHTDNFPLKLGQKDVDGRTCEEDICQEANDGIMVNTKYADPEKNLLYSVIERQARDSEFQINIDEQKVKTQVELLSTVDTDRSQHSTVVHVVDKDLVECDHRTVNKRQEMIEEETDEKTESGESSKKVTFLLEPEVINESTLTKNSTSMESTTETHVSGENNKLLV